MAFSTAVSASSKIDDLQGVVHLEEFLDGVDHVVDASRVVVRREIVDELPCIESAVDGRAIRCESEPFRPAPEVRAPGVEFGGAGLVAMHYVRHEGCARSRAATRRFARFWTAVASGSWGGRRPGVRFMSP